MRLPHVLNDLTETVQIGAEKVIGSGRTAAAVSVYSVVAGLSAFINWFTEALPTMAIMAGMVGALVLAWLNWQRIKVVKAEARKLEWEADNAELKNQELRAELEVAKIKQREVREELREMGVETRKADRE